MLEPAKNDARRGLECQRRREGEGNEEADEKEKSPSDVRQRWVGPPLGGRSYTYWAPLWAARCDKARAPVLSEARRRAS